MSGWKIYKNDDGRLVWDGEPAESADDTFDGLVAYVMDEADSEDNQPRRRLAPAGRRRAIERCLVKYAMRHDSGLELFSGRFLWGSAADDFYHKIGPALRQAIKMSDSDMPMLWMARNVPKKAVLFAHSLASVIEGMTKSDAFGEWGDSAIYYIADDIMANTALRFNVRKLLGTSSANPRRV